MKPRSFLALVGLTVLAVIAAVLAVIDQPALTTLTKGEEKAFEGLSERLNEAAELVVRSNEATFSIVKTSDGWGMKDRAKYLVHFDKVKTALVSLSELKLLESKTSDPARYKRLEVEEPDAEEAQSVRFELKDGAGESMASGLIGRLNPNLFGDGGGGTYLRRGKEEQSWLAAGEVTLGKTRNDWLVRDIVDIAAEQVRRAVIRQPGGAEIVVTQEKPDSGEYKLEGVPEGRKLKDSSEAKNLAGGLWRLTFEDVKPAAEVQFPEQTNVSVYETFDGLRVHIEMTMVDKVVWGRFSATAEEASGDKADEVRKKAEEITARAKGWVYELSAGEGERLTTRIEDILEEPKKS
ncbi:MAG: DUF4340 domain-containing protein [Defluviicoccus sp.]|nr:DUF4340 domain-containing protein [Defluviicoccus sp.]MDE0386652.1 DUF4340 domain-containing protein [Defluviicoccus sp.]